jgi:hypothetical protein
MLSYRALDLQYLQSATKRILKMKTRFSKSTGCRYPFDLDYPTLPDDIEIMDEADVVVFVEKQQTKAIANALAAQQTPEAIAARSAVQEAADMADALKELLHEQFADELKKRCEEKRAARLVAQKEKRKGA